MSGIQLPARPRFKKPRVPSGPVGGVADPRFRYVPAVATDIGKTFRRVRAEMAKGRQL